MTSFDFFEEKARECGFTERGLIRDFYDILHDRLIPKKESEFKFNEADDGEEALETNDYLLLTADNALGACFLFSQFGFVLKLDKNRNQDFNISEEVYYYNLVSLK